ncbi:MAG: hypothetical protein IJV58_10550 [Oscillospiraceae bacterium]|nr:hypothetical protein [Oscillospiraceae bacterium]MBR1897804.1 hypothetical protein [Oscillospiraceae bacterium]
MTDDKKNAPVSDEEIDALVGLLDGLCEAGSQHINLNTAAGLDGARVQTVNSTECGGRPGPCAVPNEGGDPEDDEDF